MGKHQGSRKSTTIEGKVFTENTAKSQLLEIKRESASKLNLKLINRITNQDSKKPSDKKEIIPEGDIGLSMNFKIKQPQMRDLDKRSRNQAIYYYHLQN